MHCLGLVRTLSTLIWLLLRPGFDGAAAAAAVTSSQFPELSSGSTVDDLVVVFGTTAANLHPDLVKATRSWRKGIAAFIATNVYLTASELEAAQASNEIYVAYPDSTDGRTQYPGDTRAVLTPLLAHKALRGQYKWQLYGDDDTIWFVHGVLELASQLDPNLPYIITDACYYHNWNKPGHERFSQDGALQCLPCNFQQAAWHEAEGAAFTPPIACPCTTQTLCDADKRGIMGADCQMPEWFKMIHHTDGGAGVIISHGLMEALDARAYEDCVTSADGIASDYVFSRCMWQSGFATTFPRFDRMPQDVPKEQTLFNPGGLKSIHHNPDRNALVSDLLAAVQNDSSSCNNDCIDRLKSMISFHLKSQRTANMRSGIFLLQSISALYDSFLASFNRDDLAHSPLIPEDQAKRPNPDWKESDLPVIQPSRRIYNFSFVADEPRDHEHHAARHGF